MVTAMVTEGRQVGVVVVVGWTDRTYLPWGESRCIFLKTNGRFFPLLSTGSGACL